MCVVPATGILGRRRLQGMPAMDLTRPRNRIVVPQAELQAVREAKHATQEQLDELQVRGRRLMAWPLGPHCVDQSKDVPALYSHSVCVVSLVTWLCACVRICKSSCPGRPTCKAF